MCKCAKRENLNMKAGQIYSTCDSACPGNMTQKACGGAYALNTYYLTPGSLNNYTTDYYKGCYSPTDGAAGINAATTYKFDAGTMTPDVCRDACLAKGTKVVRSEVRSDMHVRKRFQLRHRQLRS